MPTTKSKNRGVPMQDWQVRSLLAGTMSQFRVPVKPQPPEGINDLHGGELSKRAPYDLEHPESFGFMGRGFQDDDDVFYRIPYQPGEVLFIRETFMHVGGGIVYRADIHLAPDWKPPRRKCWSPPQHMREVDSRKLRIRITSVGLGRRQEITADDAELAGVECSDYCDPTTGEVLQRYTCDGFESVHPEGAFAQVWDAQHAKRNRWEKNGFDWTFGFELTD